MGNSPSNSGSTHHVQRKRSDYEKINWTDFLEMIRELNKKCFRVRNEKNEYICFALDKTCVDGPFWKQRAKIKCFSVNVDSLQVKSSKVLNLEEFLNVYNVHRDAIRNVSSNVMCSSRYILDQTADNEGQCCICMDNCNEILLPCLHSFCLACIAQEVEFRPLFSCPVCKARIEHPIENSWEVADAPEPVEVVTYLSKLSRK